jgi:hypothetical protein
MSVAKSQTIYEKKDKFDGTTHYFTLDKLVKLEGGSFLSMRYVKFSFHIFNPPASPLTPYILTVNTNTPEWVFIGAGGSLILKIAGNEMLTLSGPGSLSSREVQSANSLSETAVYLLSLGDLQKIARAKSIDFRIIGDKQNITGSWKPDLIADAGAFLKGANASAQMATSAEAPPAVPSNLALTCPPPEGLVAPRAKFGINYAPIVKQSAELLHMQSVTGVYVASVVPGSVAETTGIHRGDVVLQINGKSIATICDVPAALIGTEKGSIVPVLLWRDSAEAVLQAQF